MDERTPTQSERENQEGAPEKLGPLARDYLSKINDHKKDRPKADISTSEPICEPDCEICGGIGYLRYDVDYNHPLFGKLDLCPNIDRWNLPFARQFGITKDESSLTWKSIMDVNDAKDGALMAKRLLDKGYGWLYLWGSNGLAKTTILKIAVAQWIRDGHIGSYTRMAEILDHLRAAFDSDSGSFASEERLDFWAEVPLLAIDEFDRIRSTRFSSERQFLLLDRRYESAVAQRSITIIASERSPSGFPGYMKDRIYDGRFTVLNLQGDSLRPGMEWDE